MSSRSIVFCHTCADEFPKRGEYEIGSLAMANAGPNTNGSQFFTVSGAHGVSLPPSEPVVIERVT